MVFADFDRKIDQKRELEHINNQPGESMLEKLIAAYTEVDDILREAMGLPVDHTYCIRSSNAYDYRDSLARSIARWMASEWRINHGNPSRRTAVPISSAQVCGLGNDQSSYT